LIAVRLRKRLPEIDEEDARGRFQRAHGGTGHAGACRMMTFRIEIVPYEAGSSPPASEAPEPEFWGAAQRVDTHELQVQCVCFVWITTLTTESLAVCGSLSSQNPPSTGGVISCGRLLAPKK
jgi:hypothetical protein